MLDEIPDWLLRCLRSVPGLDATPSGDGVIAIHRGGTANRLRVRSIPRVGTREREWLLQETAAGRDLLLTSRLSPASRDELAQAGWSWVEKETGLVHMDTPAMLIHAFVPARAVDDRTPHQGISLRGAGEIIGELILAELRDRDFALGEIAGRVGVTKARISQILSALVAEGWVGAEGRTRTRHYRLKDVASLLDSWAKQTAAPAHESRAYRWTRTVQALYPRLTHLDEMQVGWALGGVAAAQVYEASLTVAPIPTVWIEASVSVGEIVSVLEAEPVEPGELPNLVFWQTDGDPALRCATQHEPSWMSGLPMKVVSLPRAYAESHRAGGRGADAAEALRDRILR
jgi:hypothetical protein